MPLCGGPHGKVRDPDDTKSEDLSPPGAKAPYLGQFCGGRWRMVCFDA